jgi:hypothetical protein
MSALFEDLKTGLSEVSNFLDGERKGYKVNLPAEIDVKAIRKDPEAAARAFLIVIANNPKAVIAALQPPKVKRKAVGKG